MVISIRQSRLFLLKRQWLNDGGFEIDDAIIVKCEAGKLVILMPDILGLLFTFKIYFANCELKKSKSLISYLVIIFSDVHS